MLMAASLVRRKQAINCEVLVSVVELKYGNDEIPKMCRGYSREYLNDPSHKLLMLGRGFSKRTRGELFILIDGEEAFLLEGVESVGSWSDDGYKYKSCRALPKKLESMARELREYIAATL